MKRLSLILAGLLVAVFFVACENVFDFQKNGSELDKLAQGTVNSELIGTTVGLETTTDNHSVVMERMGQNGIVPPMGPGGFGMGMPGMGFKGHHLPPCATVTQSSATYPKTITIDFGTGCADKHGVTKKGKIVINITDSMINPGATYSVEYVDFYINNRLMECTETVKNKGKDANGQWIIESTQHQKITHEDGTVTVRDANRIQTWVAGYETPLKDDDEFYQTGSTSGNIGDTLKYSSVIKTPLYFKNTCRAIVSGVIEITRNSVVTTVDFGAGDCDTKVSVTVDGVTTEMDMRDLKLDGIGMMGMMGKGGPKGSGGKGGHHGNGGPGGNH